MNGVSKDKFGYVITYFPEKGYGFICDNDEEDEYFFHISSLDKPFDIIPYKTKVVFKLIENSKGLCAVNIRKHTPKIEGKFGQVTLPNLSKQLTNKDSYNHLKKQQEQIQMLVEACKKAGMEVNISTNGWITLDCDLLEDIYDINPENGKWKRDVPSGYPDTFDYIFDLLQKQINYLNKAYTTSVKGIQGEEKTSQSLKAVSINYPVLHNVLLEEGSEDNRFSAETDTIVITDRAIFLIETKNFGGKGDKITVSEDGRWEIFDRYQKKAILIKNNPYKQVTDHIFVMRKFLESHNIEENLPIIPIIAIANNDVNIEIKNSGLSKVLRTDLLGTYILQYLDSHPVMISKKTMDTLSHVFNSENMPPKKYKVINYFENIKTILNNLTELITCYKADLILQEKIDKEFREKKLLEEEECEKKQKLEAEESRKKEAEEFLCKSRESETFEAKYKQIEQRETEKTSNIHDDNSDNFSSLVKGFIEGLLGIR